LIDGLLVSNGEIFAVIEQSFSSRKLLFVFYLSNFVTKYFLLSLQ